MGKFPQFKWMEIDGRMVPSIKPQHYKKGSTTETQLTGHDNPLPVANYTQNDSGVWLPTSKDNPVPTQVTGSKGEYETFFEREIRNESTSSSRLYKPDWAKGFIAYLLINGVTGSFGDNQGIALRYRGGYKIGRASCRERV